jgi:hypothetical protein
LRGEVKDASPEELPADTAPLERRRDEHHADPAEVVPQRQRRRGPDDPLADDVDAHKVPDLQKHPPIGVDLVPARGGGELHRPAEIAGA